MGIRWVSDDKVQTSSKPSLGKRGEILDGLIILKSIRKVQDYCLIMIGYIINK
jgi:hypothetical protein